MGVREKAVLMAGFWRGMFARRQPMQMAAPTPAVKFSVDVPPEMRESMTASGSIEPRVSRSVALQVPAVLRARNLICGSIGTLPLRVHGPDRRVATGVTYLVPQPDPEIPASVMMAMTVEDLLFEGVAWWRVTRFGWHGYPVEARHVPVDSVHVAQTHSLMPSQMQISPDQMFPADGQVFIDGLPVPDHEIIRFDSPNPPLLRHAARAIRTCLLLDQAAALYAKDPLPLGYFTERDGAEPPQDDEVQAILDDWAANRHQRAWGYVGALEAKTLQWNPEQLQLADQRQHAVLEIARAAGVDPEDLGVSTTSRTYQNSEQRRQDLLDFTLGAYVSAIQERLSMRDVLPRGYTARIDFAGFLRSDTKTRMETYEIGLRVGAYTHDEIRDLEHRPPLTAAQRAASQATQPAPPAQREAPRMSQAKFTADEPTRMTFAGDDVAATFRADIGKRTVSGLAVPWGAVAYSGGAQWKFTPGSLHWSSDTRVKMNVDHDHGQTIGRGVRLQSTPQGLDTTFRVARGAEGDKALALAEDGVYDGFSIEVDFAGHGDGWEQDPHDPQVRLVHSATLRAVALTAMPAFDDARVVRVAATRDEKGSATMASSKSQPEGGQGAVTLAADGLETFMTDLADRVADSHKNLTEGLAASIGDSITEGVKAALENLHDPQKDGPQPVRAARFTVTREAPVYTLNGGGPSLVRDAWHAQMSRDDEAIARIRKFRQQTEEMAKIAAAKLHFATNQALQFATATTGTASEVIPPGYRPDLFVPQMAQGRPFVNACSRGTISNATPFVVPVFGSVTGGAGDHTEGTNPTDGTLAFNTKTVTPGAISGLLKLTREIVDSSNPAIDQIALAAMREDYARQTEAKVYAMLNGTDGQGGTITSGQVPSGAQVRTTTGGSAAAGTFGGAELLDGIRAAMAVYPFKRFAAPNQALLSQEATTALATAKDTTDRPLLPSVGAQNSSGIGNAVTQGWFVDGLAHVPAWAITGNTASDADVFILNSMDAWVWESPLLTFRYEERSGPAVIDLALFGYFGTHVLRPVGLSAIRHTVGA